MTEPPFLPILLLLLILGGGLFIVVIRTERAGPSPQRILTRSIVLLLGLCLTVDDSPFRDGTSASSSADSSVETYIFPAGQILRNESGGQPGGSQPQFNRLTYQAYPTAPRESIQLVQALENPPILSLHAPAPQLITSGDLAVLVLGPHVFQRTPPGPFASGGWAQISTVALDRSHHPVTDPQQCLYLRSFLPPGDPRLDPLPYRDQQGALAVPDLQVPYHFHHFDLERMHYTLRRAIPGTCFPEYLVYSIPPLQKHLALDLPLTRALNHLPPPADDGLQIQFHLITRPAFTRPAFPHPAKTPPHQPPPRFAMPPPPIVGTARGMAAGRAMAAGSGMAAGRAMAAGSGMAAAGGMAAASGMAAAGGMAAGFSIAAWYGSPQPLRAAAPTLSLCTYRDYPYDPVEPPRRLEVQFMFFDALPDHACIAWRRQWQPPFEVMPQSWSWAYVKLDEFYPIPSLSRMPRGPPGPSRPFTSIFLRLSRSAEH